MTTWRDFLVENAKFPFPPTQRRIDETDGTTDISIVEAGLLAPEWKARYAVQDKHLLKKLCQTLDNILGDTHLPGCDEDQLLSSFGRRLQFKTIGQREFESLSWSLNDCEAQVRVLDSCSRPSSPY